MMRFGLYIIVILGVYFTSPTPNPVPGDGGEKAYKPPMMGWASWNNYRVNINEDIIKEQADAMVDKGLKNVGYSYINIDDGFFGGRDEQGRLLAHPEKFPSGMQSLANYIHSWGLKAGIYSDAGLNTCAVQWDDDPNGAGVGLYGHEYEDIHRFFIEWEYDFLKVDWCGGQNLGLDEQSRYTKIGEMIREIKPEARYNVCRWEFPGEWVTSIADSWRISPDIHKKFESIMEIVDLNADLWRYCSPGHYNDMDMLQVGRGMSREEDKTHFTMWCVMNSPLITGNDLTTMSEETLEILTNSDLIAINQDPLAYQARRMMDYGDTEVWACPLKSTMSGEVVIVLLNRSEEAKNIAFNVDDLAVQSSKGYQVKDLWTKQESRSNAAALEYEVPAHGVVALKLKGMAHRVNLFQYEGEMPEVTKITEF
ncbi:glycoside hydrolase family 27 protein [Persicobacter diffluens]|uniref:Alpha-galactosidase n=1 Tax=Persicobacter diffluens TaxID=981 RepID=A0AAN4W269_9BACT|nr:hypothetical protein PEDI_49610 [Persicobacter diffluens]